MKYMTNYSKPGLISVSNYFSQVWSYYLHKFVLSLKCVINKNVTKATKQISEYS